MRIFTLITSFFLVVLCIATVTLTAPVYAVNIFTNTCGSAGVANKSDVCNDVNGQTNNGSSTNPVISGIKSAINVLSVIIGVASVMIIIISGLRMVLNSGDPKAVSAAKNGVIYAAIGIIIAIFAQAIVVFVLDKLT